MLHRAGELRQGRHGLLGVAGGLLGALRQVFVAAGNLGAGQGDVGAGIAHLGNDARQAALHVHQGVLQLRDLVAPHHRHLLRQIALGNRLGHAPCLLQRAANRHHVQQGERRHHQHGNAHRQHEQPFGLLRRIALRLHAGLHLLAQLRVQRLQMACGARPGLLGAAGQAGRCRQHLRRFAREGLQRGRELLAVALQQALQGR